MKNSKAMQTEMREGGSKTEKATKGRLKKDRTKKTNKAWIRYARQGDKYRRGKRTRRAAAQTKRATETT